MGRMTATLARSLGWPSAEKGRLTGESQAAPSSFLRSWSLQQREAVSSSFSSTPSKGGFWSWQKAARRPAAWPGPAPGLLIHLDTLSRAFLLTRPLLGIIYGDLSREPGTPGYSPPLSLAPVQFCEQ